MNDEIIQRLVALYLRARSYSVLELVISGLIKIRISGSSGICSIHNYFAEWACPASQPLVIPKVQCTRIGPQWILWKSMPEYHCSIALRTYNRAWRT